MPVQSTASPPSRLARGRLVERLSVEGPQPSVEAGGQEDTLERLANMRTVVPVFARELTSARRAAAELRLENRRLLERIQQLQRERSAGLRSTPPR